MSVHLRHAPISSHAEYQPFFDCPVQFGQSRDALVFPQTMLGHVIDAKNGDLYEAAARFVSHTMRRFPLDIGLQVETWVDRQLANGGGNVVRIVDSVRRRRAEEYLGMCAVPLNQLAALMGYTNSVSLHRSCLRWFGETPSLMRRQKSQNN